MKYSQYVLQIVVIVTEVTVSVCQAGEWSVWSQWSSCSVTCGYGIMKRKKTWMSPKTTDEDQAFKYEDIHECSTGLPCPIDGHWNFWGPWSECSEMCDGGVTKRERECNAPKPKHGGKDCEGKAMVSASCNDWECPDLPPNFDINKCNQTTFMCLSRLQCIPLGNMCDDTLQCHDGSDEHECKDYSSAGPIHSSTIPALLCFILLLLMMS